jgi:hypothetical protein
MIDLSIEEGSLLVAAIVAPALVAVLALFPCLVASLLRKLGINQLAGNERGGE